MPDVSASTRFVGRPDEGRPRVERTAGLISRKALKARYCCDNDFFGVVSGGIDALAKVRWFGLRPDVPGEMTSDPARSYGSGAGWNSLKAIRWQSGCALGVAAGWIAI
jgi:hypothetical protein